AMLSEISAQVETLRRIIVNSLLTPYSPRTVTVRGLSHERSPPVARCPLLTWRPVTIKDPYRAPIKAVRVNLHVAVSEARTLHGYFNQSIKNPDSHAYIRDDGSGEQYVDTARQPYADLEGNGDT